MQHGATPSPAGRHEPLSVVQVTRVARKLRELALSASQGGASLPISPAEVAVIEALARQGAPATITLLCQATGLAQSWVSKLVNDFAAAGVVSLTKNPKDLRQTLVDLNKDVRAQIFGDFGERVIDPAFDVAAPGLTAAERERVKHLVLELDQIFGDSGATVRDVSTS